MDRYSATRLVLRICVLALAIGPARGQVQVGELMVTPAADGVTVTLAQAGPAQQELPQDGPYDRPQERPQVQQYQAADSVPAPARHEPQHEPHITRISLSADELPPEPALQASARPLPPLPAPRSHEMERDVLTLKAAHAAMLLEDQLHEHNKLAALR